MNKWSFGALILIVGAAYFLFTKSAKKMSVSAEQSEFSSVEPTSAATVAAPTTEPMHELPRMEPVARATVSLEQIHPEWPEVRNRFWSRIPSVQDIREQAKLDPHSSPRHYKDLALSFVELTKLGFTGSVQAAGVFNVLGECVNSNPEKVPLAVRANCLKTSKRLADKYPELQSSYKALHSSLTGRLRNHVENMEKIEARLFER